MGAHGFEGERSDVASQKSFPEIITAPEKEVPSAELAAFARLLTDRAGAAEITRVIDGMVGELGLLVLAKIDQGRLVSRRGIPKRMSMFLIGNPLLAHRI